MVELSVPVRRNGVDDGSSAQLPFPLVPAGAVSRLLLQRAVSPGRAAGADGAGYGWGCCRIAVWLSPLSPTANSGPPVRPDRLPADPRPSATRKPGGSGLAVGTAVHWVPF